MGMKSSLTSLPLSKFNQNWPISSKVIKVRGRGSECFDSTGKQVERGVCVCYRGKMEITICNLRLL